MSQLVDILPGAAHVLPIHLWKLIAEGGELLSAKDRAERGLPFVRPSTAPTDELLGVTRFVHLYLTPTTAWKNPEKTLVARVPILAQKMVKRKPPFPHVLLAFDTTQLGTAGSFLACWNIGYGRPGAGSWNKETPEERLAFWHGFIAKNKGKRERLKGYVSKNTGVEIPLFRPTDIVTKKTFIKGNARELLAPSPLVIRDHHPQLFVFSRADLKLINKLPLPAGLPRPRLASLDGYDPDKVAPETREAIEDYFVNGGDVPDLEFD